MNILEYLDFVKKEGQAFHSKGQSKESPAMSGQSKKASFFSDKYPRADGEIRFYNLLILDESGSMDSIRAQALSGVNETIQTIRTAQQENSNDCQLFSFVTFDKWENKPTVRVVVDNERIENVKEITKDRYHPDGLTPLYDAMGTAISSLQRIVREGDHVLVTVITDGLENASHIYTAEMIRDLVDSLSAKGWVFTYIGANQETEETGGRLGIRHTMDFEASAEGTGMMFDKLDSSRIRFYKDVRHCEMTGACYDGDDFFSQREAASRITPEWIDTLQEGQIFVFGSNLEGCHAGGAARIARERFGAIWGQGVGLQGQSYAIPTMLGDAKMIKPYIDEFIKFADMHPEMTFFVTRIGCGIAGYRDEDIAPLFARAYSLPNVFLPASFWKVLSYEF